MCRLQKDASKDFTGEGMSKEKASLDTYIKAGQTGVVRYIENLALMTPPKTSVEDIGDYLFKLADSVKRQFELN